MGYESRLFIVNKRKGITHNGYVYGQILSMFDLGKVYFISDVLRDYPMTECYIYDRDGNTHIMTDNYKKPLTEAPLEDAISIAEKAMNSSKDYMDIAPLVAALKSYKKLSDIRPDYDIAVLHYGY